MRALVQVHAPDYREFLDFMCPGREAGDQFPPTGSDPGACPRPILGVYDDHDWGWNNGNGRWARVAGRPATVVAVA